MIVFIAVFVIYVFSLNFNKVLHDCDLFEKMGFQEVPEKLTFGCEDCACEDCVCKTYDFKRSNSF